MDPEILERIQSLETSLTRLSDVTELLTEAVNNALLRLLTLEKLLADKGMVSLAEIVSRLALELVEVGLLGFEPPPRHEHLRRLRRVVPVEKS